MNLLRASASLRAGDWVEVKSAEEIRRTLDENAQLEDIPFMPEMLPFCGRRFQVSKRAHKTCDTVDYIGGRRLMNAVHLEDLRCDGGGHGGCNAGCLLFWKEAWLRKVDGPPGKLVVLPAAAGEPPAAAIAATVEQHLRKGTVAPGEVPGSPDPTYVCQATRLVDASVALHRSDVAQYLEDYTSGNVSLGRMLAGFTFLAYETLVGGRYGIGGLLRFLYDTLARLTGGAPYPSRRGKIPPGGKTPTQQLDLQPGELVRVKTLPEILETIDENLRNRGMGWHTEMVPFTGRTYRVLRRIEQIVHEKTGKMIRMKSPTIILDHVVCEARYINNCRRFCPRAVYPYFREIWLERVEAPVLPAAASEQRSG
jgi:hypothetical protein